MKQYQVRELIYKNYELVDKLIFQGKAWEADAIYRQKWLDTINEFDGYGEEYSKASDDRAFLTDVIDDWVDEFEECNRNSEYPIYKLIEVDVKTEDDERKEKEIRFVNVVKALLNGNRVTIGEREFVVSDDYRLCQTATSHDTQTGEESEVLLPIWAHNNPLSDLWFWLSPITEEEYTRTLMNVGLNQINRKER